MKTTRAFSIAVIAALLCAAFIHPAQAQNPIQETGSADNKTPSGGEISFANLLAQARPNRRAGFPLTPLNSANVSDTAFSITAAAAGPNLPVIGSGTIGRLTKWTGFTSSNSTIGNSTIFEDKDGLVGIGTDSPTSKLTVAGIIQSSIGGFKFPDGTIQTTSAAGALFTVAHDATLVGSGTLASPLGVAPSFVSAITGEPFQQQVNVTIPNNGIQGAASITVPGNKRMVIEFVSASCDLFSPGFLIDRFEITTSLGGQGARFQFAAVRTMTGGGIDRYVANQQVVIHADPGSTVTFFVTFPTMLTSGAVGRFSIAGRLFDAP